jgi:amino acid transporter
MEETPNIFKRIKNVLIGKAYSLQDKTIFHKISLVAFFAWIGLGSDGLTSSCYGPQEAYLALNGHIYLSIFVALGTVITIFVISASYSQIVELFPHGGGGYLVASKLLSPSVGMISGCALLIDYVLTITVSIASGADAIFSLLPERYYQYKLFFAIGVVFIMVLLNMRGVRESILPLVPIFLTFIVTHVFIIIYSFAMHLSDFEPVAAATSTDITRSLSELGLLGAVFLVLRSYSMGAGTYTGLEAVSNAVPVLREPKVDTAKRTMFYMAISLSFVVVGLMLSFIFYKVTPMPGRTLNAILFERITTNWGGNAGYIFVIVTLISEAVLLFVAAQTGFIDGPRVLANMAQDRWFPTRFSTLSDRLVIQNGILIFGGMAITLMLISHASVRFLVVLYSINVFLTFVLSQLGMVRHWWLYRATVKRWARKLLVNGIGLILTAFILFSMVVIKFHEGGWITIFITGSIIILAVMIKRHYMTIGKILTRLDPLVKAVTESPDKVEMPGGHRIPGEEPKFDPEAKTAVLLVNGFNGMGLHTLLGVVRLFGDSFKNYAFLNIGVIDTGNFKGIQEMGRLNEKVKSDVDKYVSFMTRQGFYAEGIPSVGVNVVDEVSEMAPKILERFPNAVFFGGQLLFEKDSMISKVFHNYTVFTLQKRLYRDGIPFVILPIRI